MNTCAGFPPIVVGDGFLVFVMLANGASALPGAPEYGPLFMGAPVAGIGLLAAAILVPANKPILHAAGFMGFCVWRTRARGRASSSTCARWWAGSDMDR